MRVGDSVKPISTRISSREKIVVIDSHETTLKYFLANLSQTFLPAVVSGDFELAEFLIPTRSLVGSFNAFAEPLLDQIYNLHNQNQLLRAAPDLLLPRLMSGEVAV